MRILSMDKIRKMAITVCFALEMLASSAIHAADKPAVLLCPFQNQHQEDQMRGVEKRAEALVGEALNRSCLFSVMDSQAIKSDSAAGSSGLPDIEALTLLKGKGVDYAISGVLTGDDLATEITLKFIRTDSGQIEKSLKAANITTPHIDPIVRKLFAALREAFPVHGKVIQIDEDKIYIDIGKSHGVKEGDRFAIVVFKDIKSGEEIIDREEETVATLTIGKAMEKSAWGTCTQESSGTAEKVVEVGLSVFALPEAKRRAGGGPSSEEIITLKAFENLSGEASSDHIGRGISEALTTDLTASKRFWVVESTQLDKILDEQRLSSSSIFDPSTTAASGLLWRARYVISGSFQKLDELYRLDGRMMDLETSEVVAAESIIGSNVLELTKKLGDVFLSNLDRKWILKDSQLEGIKVEVQTAEQIPMAIYHLLPALNAPILEFRIRNETDRKMRLVLSSEIVGISQPAKEIVEVESGRELTKSQYPALLPGKLKEIVSAGTYNISLQVALADGRSVYEESRTSRLLSYDTLVFGQDFIRQRPDLLPTVAAWVRPNITDASALLVEASNKTSQKAMTGYQPVQLLTGIGDTLSPEQRKLWTREQVKAIYEVLKERDIRYVDQSTQFPSSSLQRVLLPDEALKHKSANCIDGAVLFSSLMVRAGLRPVIIIVPGHAFVGWETWEGTEEYEVLETTKLGYAEFEAAMEEGLKRAREAGLEKDLAALRFKKGEFRKGKCTILNIHMLKEKMADIPV